MQCREACRLVPDTNTCSHAVGRQSLRSPLHRGVIQWFESAVSKTVNPGSNPGSPVRNAGENYGISRLARHQPVSLGARRRGRIRSGPRPRPGMPKSPTDPPHQDATRLLVEEILRTGLMLTDLVCELIERRPEDAFPGEDHADVLVEMLVGTVRPAAEAAGAADGLPTRRRLSARSATCTLADLEAAIAQLARDSKPGPESRRDNLRAWPRTLLSPSLRPTTRARRGCSPTRSSTTPAGSRSARAAAARAGSTSTGPASAPSGSASAGAGRRGASRRTARSSPS